MTTQNRQKSVTIKCEKDKTLINMCSYRRHGNQFKRCTPTHYSTLSGTNKLLCFTSTVIRFCPDLESTHVDATWLHMTKRNNPLDCTLSYNWTTFVVLILQGIVHILYLPIIYKFPCVALYFPVGFLFAILKINDFTIYQLNRNKRGHQITSSYSQFQFIL